MNAKRAWLVIVVFIVGGIVGWLGADYVHLRAASSQALVEMGQIDGAAKTGDFQRAIMYATRATTLDPKNHLATLGLAELYERVGQRELAIAYYQESLRLLQDESVGAGERSHIEKRLKQLMTARETPSQASTAVR